MECEDFSILVGRTVARATDMEIEFSDGSVLSWDHDGCAAIYSAEEWAALIEKWKGRP
jgi:hypothetical protein